MLEQKREKKSISVRDTLLTYESLSIGKKRNTTSPSEPDCGLFNFSGREKKPRQGRAASSKTSSTNPREPNGRFGSVESSPIG